MKNKGLKKAVGEYQQANASGYSFEIPMLNKHSARVFIPNGVTQENLDYLKLYISQNLPGFLDNLKTEL